MEKKEREAWAKLARAGAACAAAWRTIAEAGKAKWPDVAPGEPSAAETWAREAERWAKEGAAMLAPFPREEVAAMLEEAGGPACELGNAAWTLDRLADLFADYAAKREKGPGERARLATLAEQHVRQAGELARKLDAAERGEAEPVPAEDAAKAMVEDEPAAWTMATGAGRLEEVADTLAAYVQGPLQEAVKRQEAKVGALGFPGARMKLAQVAEEQVRAAARILQDLDRAELGPPSPSSSAAWKAWDNELGQWRPGKEE